MVVPQGATHLGPDGKYYKQNRSAKWLVYSEKLNLWAFTLYVDASSLTNIKDAKHA